MAHILADRVRETSTTTGAGALTLGGAVPGFRTFASAMSVGDTCDYVVSMGGSWEVGFGTLSSATVLARTTVLASSNSGAAVNFAAGLKDVQLGISAAKLGSPWVDTVRYNVNASVPSTPAIGLNVRGRTTGAADALTAVDAAGNATHLNPPDVFLSQGRVLSTGAAVATVDISLPSEFSGYCLHFDYFQPNTSGEDLLLRVSVDGGATYIAGTAYFYGSGIYASDTTQSPLGAGGVSSIQLLQNQITSTTRTGSCGVLHVRQPGAAASGQLILFWQGSYLNTSTIVRWVGGAGLVGMGAGNRATNLRFLSSSGTIKQIAYRLYGVQRIQGI
jgi:hypothetical protein